MTLILAFIAIMATAYHGLHGLAEGIQGHLPLALTLTLFAFMAFFMGSALTAGGSLAKGMLLLALAMALTLFAFMASMASAAFMLVFLAFISFMATAFFMGSALAAG